MEQDFQKICVQLQVQRNSFADAHAAAAARADQLAEQVERLTMANAYADDRIEGHVKTIASLQEALRIADNTVGDLRITVKELLGPDLTPRNAEQPVDDIPF